MTREEAINVLDEWVGTGRIEEDCSIRFAADLDDVETALDMAISALREQPRWIPVEEMLPDPKVSGVLIWCGSYIEIGWYDNEDGVWRSDLVNDYEGDVTHWMPLPSPPEVVE